jgi:hypothetical protein
MAWLQCISLGNLNILPNELLVLTVVLIILVRTSGCSLSYVIIQIYYFYCCCYYYYSSLCDLSSPIYSPPFTLHNQQSALHDHPIFFLLCPADGCHSAIDVFPHRVNTKFPYASWKSLVFMPWKNHGTCGARTEFFGTPEHRSLKKIHKIWTNRIPNVMSALMLRMHGALPPWCVSSLCQVQAQGGSVEFWWSCRM